MILLSLDLSTKSTGAAIFDDNKLIHYECISASSTDVIKRIYKIKNKVNELLNEFSVDQVVAEEVRFGESNISNVKTYKALNYIQAAIVFTVYDYNPNIKIEYLQPSEWRSKVGIKTGRGIKRESLKKEDIQFVKDKYNIDVNDDIADAILLGEAYLSNESSMYCWE